MNVENIASAWMCIENIALAVTAEGLAGPSDDPQHYVSYVTQLVQRYSGSVHAVEVWNEQNLEREWYTAGGLSASAYMNLLIPAAEAIHAVPCLVSGLTEQLRERGRRKRHPLPFLDRVSHSVTEFMPPAENRRPRGSTRWAHVEISVSSR